VCVCVCAPLLSVRNATNSFSASPWISPRSTLAVPVIVPVYVFLCMCMCMCMDVCENVCDSVEELSTDGTDLCMCVCVRVRE